MESIEITVPVTKLNLAFLGLLSDVSLEEGCCLKEVALSSVPKLSCEHICDLITKVLANSYSELNSL